MAKHDKLTVVHQEHTLLQVLSNLSLKKCCVPLSGQLEVSIPRVGIRVSVHDATSNNVTFWNKFRFRNHISTLPQPNFGDSAAKNIYASETKKSRFRNQKKDDSATKKRRFRNQKKTIPKPKNPDSATKKRRFRNHHPRDSETKIRVTLAATLNMASSPDAEGLGWVGWGGKITSWQLRSFL